MFINSLAKVIYFFDIRKQFITFLIDILTISHFSIRMAMVHHHLLVAEATDRWKIHLRSSWNP